jgi:predicted PurR-regulated permease PerM
VRAADLLSAAGMRRFLARWGFPLFVVGVLIVGRQVLLPFIFASLIAYILAPAIRWMSERRDRTVRMPRGVAIILCYLVFLATVTGFMFLLVPRIVQDAQRIGDEAPALIKKINDEWTPQFAHWLEKRIPRLKAPDAAPVPVADTSLPKGTAFTVTQLPDGRLAVQLGPSGLAITPSAAGGYHIAANEAPPEAATLEEKLRSFLGKGLFEMRSKINDVVAFGHRLVSGLVKGVFAFFITLMLGAFILIDMEKVHSFLRSLFPPHARADYDVIIAGIDRGLSGVIRGQLLICLVNGILTFIGLMIFQVKYSLILAAVAAVMSLIPIFGSILSTVPIVLASLVSGEVGLDLFRAVMMTLWIIGIHFLEANFLNPKIIGTAAKVHPVLVVFSLVLGEHSFGLVGALLAVPVLSSIQVIFMFLYRRTWKTSLEAARPG